MAKIRNAVFRNNVTPEDGDRIFTKSRQLVDLMSVTTTEFGAGDAAKRFNRSTTYDSESFALAQRLEAELWTADDRFVNSMGLQRPNWVKRLFEFN